MNKSYTDSIVENEPTVTIPLSLYKELLEICKLYRQQSSYRPNYNPDPIVPDYTRPQPNDWPFGPSITCSTKFSKNIPKPPTCMVRWG